MIDELLNGAGSTCCLCAQIDGRPDGDLLHRMLGADTYERRIALESAGTAVVPSLGPLAPGHVLVCPKSHHRSVAATSLELQRELNAVAERTASLLTQIFHAPVHSFEHGDASRGHDVSCSVEHAHLHLLPTTADPWLSLRGELDWRPIREGESLAELTGGEEYLYYARPDGESFVHLGSGDGPLPSQLLRLRFAEAMGAADTWNWRLAPRPALADENYRALRHHGTHAAVLSAP
jgi:diadenosine tetraphosphate (Ap4A) HIT family hydrolase